MMLADLVQLFDRVPADAQPEAYKAAIIEQNDLAKPSRVARQLAHEYLTGLYGLDPAVPLFRHLRRLWDVDPAARPQLALAIAVARDPLLRASMSWLLAQRHGDVLTCEVTKAHVNERYPDRFSPVMSATLAQRLNATWTQAGLLQGKVRKVRVRPTVTPVNLAFNLFIGFMAGASGQLLLRSPWVALLDLPTSEDLEALLRSAAHQELLVWRAAAGVTELRFPGWLTSEDEVLLQEVAREST